MKLEDSIFNIAGSSVASVLLNIHKGAHTQFSVSFTHINDRLFMASAILILVKKAFDVASSDII